MNRTLWRSLIPFAMPFLLSALLAWVLHSGSDYAAARDREQADREWADLARQAAARIRCSHRFATHMENRFFQARQQLEAVLSIISSTSDLDTATLLHVFHGAVPRAIRPPGTRIYAFRVEDGGDLVALSGQGLSRDKVTAMTRIVHTWVRINKEGVARPEVESRSMAWCKRVFGPEVTPALMGLYQKGRLVPIQQNRRRHYLMWDIAERSGKPALVYVWIFPEAARTGAAPVVSALNATLRFFRGSLYPVLIPLRSHGSDRHPVFPNIRRPSASLRDLARRISLTPNRARVFPAGSVTTALGPKMLRTFFSKDLPYELWIIATEPPTRDASRHRSPAALIWPMFFLGWGLFLFRCLLFGSPPAFSLRSAFPLLFFLAGATPLAAIFLVGHSLIQTSTTNRIQHLRREMIERIDNIDNNSSLVLVDFVKTAEELFQHATWLQHPGKYSPAELDKVAAKVFQCYRERYQFLDTLLLFLPGQEGRVFTPSGVIEPRDQSKLDSLAPLIVALMRAYRPDLDSGRIIRLSPYQRKFFQTLQTVNKNIEQNYKDIDGTGQISQTVGGAKFLSYFRMLSDRGSFAHGLFFLADAEAAFQRYLLKTLDQLESSQPRFQHLLSRVHPGGMSPLLPHPTGSYWHSLVGGEARAFLDLVGHTDIAVSRRIDMTLYVGRACRRIEGFLLGMSTSLEPIMAERQFYVRLLWLFLALLAAVLLSLGYATGNHLIPPLLAVESRLRTLGEGNIPAPLALSRSDEVGVLAETFNDMVRGLKKRRQLGRFVSGTLDRSVAEARSVDAAAAHLMENAAVLVSDIRSFTTLSEQYEPELITAMLNHHLETHARIIQAQGGQIDRFVGDAIIAVFEATSLVEAARRSLVAAIAMRKGHLHLQEQRRRSGPFTYEIGIGIAAGAVMAGTIGASRRKDFTMFGSPRDRAEELEVLSKRGRTTRIMVDAQIHAFLHEEYAFVPIDRKGFELAALPADHPQTGGRT